MAERRMFAKTIIDSDAFLDMPLSTQALYFHLSMRADDEGFINNPKKIQRMIGASDDDMKVLYSKNFVIAFESGIVVIKHWRIHNYIRADRLVETKYKEERALLNLKDNGSYTLDEGLKEIENLDSKDLRKIAYKESSLPYSFEYKIRRAFEGAKCPICNCIMTNTYRLSMPTIQHNIPISKGGKHELDNISVICESCNTSIKDKETGLLNNADVIAVWEKIVMAEKNNIDWFWNPGLLNDGQLTDKCQANVSIGKVSIGKNSIGKDNNTGDKSPKRFIPPTLDEVKAYCKERKNSVDPETFVDFYEAKGWMVGKNKMKDWKAAIRTWERNRNSVSKKPDMMQRNNLDKLKELEERALKGDY